MSKIIFLQGIPASGKSTWAKQYVASNPNAIRINNDDLRTMFHDGKWSKSNEKLITKARNILIETFLLDGKTVIVDNLNLAPKHKEQLKQVAKTYDAEFETKVFDITIDEAIKRDLNRANSVGRDVIMQWYNDYMKPKALIYIPPENKPQAIICDIDGSLAHIVCPVHPNGLRH